MTRKRVGDGQRDESSLAKSNLAPGDVDSAGSEKGRFYRHLYNDLLIMLEVRDALDGGSSFRTVDDLAKEIERRRHQSAHSSRPKGLSGGHLRKIVGEVEKLFFGRTHTIVERDYGRPDNAVQQSDQAGEEDEGGWRLPRESDELANAEAVFDAIRELLISQSKFHRHRQTYCLDVGASHATEWVVENAIVRFHHDIAKLKQLRGIKCDVVINHGKSHELRRDGTSGKYHIVVASCADLSLRQQGRVSIGSASLDLHLLVHRRNQLATKKELTWSDLAGWTLIVPSLDRWPRPSLPAEIFNQGLRLVTTEHYRDALASVRASGDSKRMACVAAARLHAPRELRHLRAYNLPGLSKLLLIGAFKSSVRFQKAGKTGQLLVNKLGEAILAEFHSLSGSEMEGQVGRYFPTHALTTYHVKRITTAKGAQQLVWTPGYIINLGLKPSGQFEADHLYYDRQVHGTILSCPLIGEVLRTGNQRGLNLALEVRINANFW